MLLMLLVWAPSGTAAAVADAAQGRSNGSAAVRHTADQSVQLGPYTAQWWESGEGLAAHLDDRLRSLTDEQLARARAAAGAAADSLTLTDAPLMFPPGQLALAAMRAAFRKVSSLPSLLLPSWVASVHKQSRHAKHAVAGCLDHPCVRPHTSARQARFVCVLRSSRCHTAPFLHKLRSESVGPRMTMTTRGAPCARDWRR